MKEKSTIKLSIFDTFKTKKDITAEAKRQRAIIVIMAQNGKPVERTRVEISRKIGKEQNTTWKNVYSGIFRDLDETLLPLKLVEEEGRLPLKRGPKALQEKGIPYYRLTEAGLFIALSIKETREKENILDKFFSMQENVDKEFFEILKKLTEFAPRFFYSLVEKYVRKYCQGDINLLPFNLKNLSEVSDESIITLKEFIIGLSSQSKSDRKKMIKFLQDIT